MTQFQHLAEREPHTYKFIKFPKKYKDKVPEFGHVKTGIENFAKKREYFKWYSIYVHDETYRAMIEIVDSCLKVMQLSLFTTSYGKYVTLEEFEATQNHYINNVSQICKLLSRFLLNIARLSFADLYFLFQISFQTLKFLRVTWLDKLTQIIRMHLGYLGKGWFNMNEKKHEIYDIAKLLRFMELIKHRMQNALRDMVLNSAEIFTNLVETPCQVCLEIEEDFEWGDDLVNSDYRPWVQPIFMLVLKMDENGAFYSTEPEEFKKMLLRLYDGAITQTHFIQQVHPAILTFLKFPKDLYLSSLGLLSEHIVELRDKFCLGYDQALIPLRAYAREFRIHIELFTLDVVQYVE